MSKPIHIVCTVTNDLLQDQRMQRICGSLQQAGYAVTLVGRLKSNSRSLPAFNFKHHRIKCWFSKGKLFYVEYNLRLFYYLLRQSPDIVNAVDLDTLLPAYLHSRLRKAVCVYDAHEYFTETPEVARRAIVQRIWRDLANWIIPKLEHCYTVGPALAKIFERAYGQPFAVVRNLPEHQPRPFDLAAPDTIEPIILYQGMLNEGRGLEVVIEAMSQLPSCKLWLVGSGDKEDQLKDLVQELNVESQVKFLGFMPPAELPGITQQAWLGLNLLESRSLSYYYSLANKTFDYINQTVPAIHMDFPEYRALKEQYDCLVLLPSLDATELAKQVQYLLDQPDKYQQLVDACRLASQELRWESESKKLLAIYDKIELI